MMGLAALVSALTGLFSGSVPKIFDMFQKSQDFKHELKVREMEMRFRREEQEMQIALAEKGISGKIEESYYEALKAEVIANGQMMVEMERQRTAPTGYWFIDMVNAAVRPTFFMTTLILFFIVIIQFIVTTPEALAAQAATQFWIAVEAAMGFVAGYRSIVKPPRILGGS